MRYEFYYWPSIQGRGEFVRLALAEADADYRDVARETPQEGGGIPAMLEMMNDHGIDHLPFAPPFMKAGRQVIAQTANILLFLGTRHNLAPKTESGRLWTHQLQLTIADFVDEIHDTHHPIAGSLYYHEQREEALRRSKDFLASRAPKYLGYFERVLAGNTARSNWLVGARATCADLSLFQVVEGMRYAFPRAMSSLESRYPRVVQLHADVAQRPRIAAYLASAERIPFNEDGIFRHYPELDSPN